jgi:hypothetical protein
MSERRQQVLDAIQRAAEPVGVSEMIAARVPLSPTRRPVRDAAGGVVRAGIVPR